MKKTALFMLPVLFAAASCQPKSEKVPAIDMSYLDLSVAPGTDFNQYANGGWIKNNPLKAEYARFGSFDQLREDNVERLNGLFAEMSKLNPAKGSVDQKIVDLYKLGLDSTRLNAEGAEPVKDELRMIYSAADKKELVAVLAKLNLAGGGGFFGMGVDADLMDSNKQVLYLGQSGLGMGDRDYYMDAENAELHSKYQQMLEKLFTLAGESDAAAKALNTVKLEDALASFSWTSVQNRDYTKLYNPMSTAEIAKTFGGFDFGYFFQAMGIPAQDKVIVEQPSFFEGFAKLFESSDLSQLQDYLAAHSLMSAAPYMSDDFYAAQFDFFSTAMSGVTEQKARWKRAMSVPNNILGEAVGQMYVKKYFPEENKKKMLEIVGELQKSLGEHIANLEWMSDQTKAYAQNKLSNFTVKVGYPDKWKDYSSLNVDPEQSYYKNIVAANTWYVADNLSKMGKATDKSEWGMTPQTVNAYYNPTTNEICFPAAILQPPFFNIDADDAVNYGAIGVVIGHEMTHGFDDQGRLFDTDGNMNNWWTAEDEAKFNEKTAVLVKQYDEVEILPGLHANGKLSLGENIADHGGVSIAYTALHNSLGDKMPADIDGFNVDQRFFIGYAHLWAQNITDEEKARLTKLDVHSLAENRINVTLRNFQAFFDAFGIKEGDPMWRPESERVSIW
ncbi:MAG: M13 family metallopeptidase [Candidatus Cryptobacteroides sp.]|nr:M13 family metallopeptidase [Bacteroidales bacterium]MDY6158890.1 M13 family metallopeptidase [Candidatus Cryptobacteroides sp.]